MKINCIIVEDEPLAQEKLIGFIEQVSFLNLLKTFDNAIEVSGFIRANQVEVMFLDIQMPRFNGMQLLESVPHMPQVVIVSAYDQYAIKGYEFNVTDFLLKPYSFERFMQAVNKVLESNEKLNTYHGNFQDEEEVLFVKSGNKIKKIELKEILFVQGMKDYQMIVSTTMKTMTLQTFKEITNVLPEPGFVRIHKSYIVSIRKIENIERNRIKIGDDLLPISDTYKDHFYEVLRKSKHLI